MGFARQFFLLIFRDWGTNQIARKALFTCLVYTNNSYWQLSGSLARSSQGSTELKEVNRTILYHVVELFLPGRHDKRLTCFRCFVRYHAWTARLTLSLPRVINSKFPLQPHQKYYITQYEELGFSYLTQMEDDYTTKFSLPHLYTYTYT